MSHISSNSFHPVIFIHGMWGGAWVFKSWLEMCHRCGIEAYAINLKTDESTTFADYVDQVEAKINRLELKNVVLIGHSLGGLIAQAIAARQPETVRALGLVASAPAKGIRYAPLFWYRLRYLKAALLGKLFAIGAVDAKTHVLNGKLDADDAISRFRNESGRVLFDVGLLGVEVGTIHCPALIIGGTEDRLLPLHVQRKIARKLQATLIEVRAGHMIPVEDGAVMKQIVAWMHAI